MKRFDIKNSKRHHFVMRTTLTLDDDIAKLVARYAQARGLSLGKSVSELVRRALNSPTPSTEKDGLLVFRLPADSPQVTTADVRRIEAESA
ncbi:MAG: ribbon-helix-helix protein, CopG family [Vicinamibacterales bacterium]